LTDEDGYVSPTDGERSNRTNAGRETSWRGPARSIYPHRISPPAWMARRKS